PCARARESELEPPGLDEPMNLVQELGDALHLVHDDPAGETRGDQIAEARWGGEELRIDARVEKIEEQSVRQVQVKPRSFPHPAGTEEEEALLLGRGEQSWIHKSFLSQKKDFASRIPVLVGSARAPFVTKGARPPYPLG